MFPDAVVQFNIRSQLVFWVFFRFLQLNMQIFMWAVQPEADISFLLACWTVGTKKNKSMKTQKN